MKYLSISLLAIVMLFVDSANAQDTIMLMRGKRLIVENAKLGVTPKNDTILTYQYNGKQKHKSVSKIFSVSGKNGERFFYSPEFEGDMTVAQMKSFLNGHADYLHGFCWWAFFGGVASANFGAVVPPIEFDDKISGTIPVGIVVPFAYLGVVSKTSRSARKIKAKNPQVPDDEYYIMGAQYAISQERMRSGAFGIIAGGVELLIISIISEAND